MRRFTHLVAIGLLVALILGGCNTETTVVVPEGPKAAALGAAKDEQIKGLLAQVKAEQHARELEQILAAKASSNFLGVLKALDYMDPSPAREAASEESKLGRERLGKDDPVETVKALQRVIDLVTGQRDKALQDYAAAKGETAQERARIVAKDVEIAARDKTIIEQGASITNLTEEAKKEKAEHAADVKKAIDAKDKEIQRVKDEAAAKERAAWVLWTRIAGLGLIVIGVVLLAVFKLVAEGAGLAAGGVLIGLISIFIDWLTSQPFFPWLCGAILLGVLVAGGYAVYRMWKKGELHNRTTAALQDLKDEAATLGHDTWDKVAEHLNYRLGEKGSFWSKAQSKAVAALGLVNPKAESTPTTISPPGP